MTYPGNPALSPDVQQRIRSTFEHTLGLAAGGSRQEALLGCDFVLRMDAQFAPARLLQERLGAAMGAVEVDDLRAAMATPAEPQAPEGWHDFLDTALPDLPDLPELGLPGASAGSSGQAAAAAAGNLKSELAGLLERRRFQELLARAESAGPAVAGDPELHRMVVAAQERLEAGPYVVRFLAAARDARRAGDVAEASRLIEKARTLDPTHPGIAELTDPATAAGPRAAAPPSTVRPPGPPADLPFQIEDAPSQQTVSPGASAVSAPPGIDLGGLRTMAIPVLGGAQPAGGDAESERRIQQLLDEGDAALAGGDPQAAIDAWSRIFLIDIDHQEASRRIEQARRLKAENERQIEEIFHDGLTRLERHDPSGARRAFERVLELQPGHLAAREYLQQLTAGDPRPVLAPLAPPSPAPPAVGPSGRQAPGSAPTPPPLPSRLVQQPAAPAEELKEEILVPPDFGKGAARTEPRREVRTGQAGDGRGKRLFLIIGSAVLLLLAAVGWFVYQNHDQWFPNSQAEEAPAPSAAAGDPISRAKRLHNTGKTPAALSQLRRIAPNDPHYKEAQELIHQWEAPEAGGAAGSLSTLPGAASSAGTSSAQGPLTPVSAAEGQRRGELLAEAMRAYDDHSYLLAAQKYDQANRLARLAGPEAVSYADAQQRLAPLARQLTMFRQHDWEFALPDLWRMHEADPANRDVTQLIVDCYYDLGVRDLQKNDPATAARNFTEAASLDSNDKSLERSLLFARTYQQRQPDLLYRIYVKYLPVR
jgi:tetratricopeptide (TPR) repeat protein